MTQPDRPPPSKPDENNPTIRILKELGEVMIPLSLWAIIAQLLSLSIQTTGLVSLYIIIVLYTWLYRNWINHRIRASLVIFFAVTATIGALLIPRTVSYSDESLSRSGIVSYGEQANDWAIPKVPTYASKAKHEVWYVGVDFHISASQHQELLLKLLANGVNVRFLFYDFLPNAPGDQTNANFGDLVKRFDYQPPQLLADLTSTVENLRKLQSRWPSKAGTAKLEIRVYRDLPWARAYLFDPGSDSGTALLVNYIYGRDTANLPALLLRNEAGGLLPSYYNGIQVLWQNATDFNDWLPKYDAYKTSQATQNSAEPKPSAN